MELLFHGRRLRQHTSGLSCRGARIPPFRSPILEIPERNGPGRAHARSAARRHCQRDLFQRMPPCGDVARRSRRQIVEYSPPKAAERIRALQSAASASRISRKQSPRLPSLTMTACIHTDTNEANWSSRPPSRTPDAYNEFRQDARFSRTRSGDPCFPPLLHRQGGERRGVAWPKARARQVIRAGRRRSSADCRAIRFSCPRIAPGTLLSEAI